MRNGVAIPIEFEPFEAVKNGGHGCVVVALAIGILDAQQEFTLAPAGVEPIENRRPAAADVQITGRRGGKTHDGRWGCGHGLGHGTFWVLNCAHRLRIFLDARSIAQ